MGIRIGLVVGLGLLLAACAAPQPASGGGSIVKEFSAPYGSVTAAARHSVETLNVEVTSANQVGDAFVVNFKKPMSTWSWGEVGWVKVYPAASGAVTVEVASQKVMKAQVTGTEQDEFASAIFQGIDKSLADLGGQ